MLKYLLAMLLLATPAVAQQAREEFNGAPQVLAAVQKRFPKATAIEQIGDESVWFEWRGERWMCALRNPSMRPMHCMTNQKWDLMRARQ
jgi:hypothetical protein